MQQPDARQVRQARTIASLSPKSAAPLVISRTRSSVVSSVGCRWRTWIRTTPW